MKSSVHKKTAKRDEKMRAQYDFSSGDRPRYDTKYPEGAVITVHRDSRKTSKKQIENKALVVLDADVFKVFPNTRSVNTALRHLIAAVPKKRESRVQ